jgi:phosphatidylserine/phosphatidylglycerophosphate/cardiolipin synthase-like enzyme
MKWAAASLVLVSVLAGPPKPPEEEVFFSPSGGVTAAVVKEIGTSKREILMQAYGFTSQPIATALLDASKRGVKVSVILDRSNLTAVGSMLPLLAKTPVTVRIDSNHAIAHNKIILIDGSTLLTGSFNFTNAAERSNAENLYIRRHCPIIAQYLANWHAHEAHSPLAKDVPEPSR